MIINASRNGEQNITSKDFDRALDLLERTEKNMPKTFAGLGTSDKAEVLHNIAQFIALRKEVYFSELMKRFMADVTKDELIQCIATLEVSGMVEKINLQNEQGQMITNNWKIKIKESGK